MVNFRHIKTLISNEISNEFQSKNTLGAILLYVISTSFVAYISFKTIDSPLVWNALFWIMILFASINTISGSFKESIQQSAYLQSLVKPQEIILGKIIYNSILLLIVTILCLGFYSLFIGNYIANFTVFFCVVILGSLTLSTILTLAAGIAYKASGNSSLFSILSIPVVIPILILMITSSTNSLNNTKFKTFTFSEMFPDEKVSIKVNLLSSKNNQHTFKDDQDKLRTITLKNKNLFSNKDYIIYGSYSITKNTFEAEQINPFKNLIQQSDYVKILSLLLISILIGGIAYLIFPKFWTE